MTGFYIVRDDENVVNGQSGISKKIYSQIDCLNRNSLDCSLYILKSGAYNRNSVIDKIKYALPFSNINPQWAYDDIFQKADYIYLRRPIFMSIYMRSMLKKIKKYGNEPKVILELPTFPYDQEYKGVKGKILLFKDRYNRKRLKGIVDLFVCILYTNDESKIWGIPYLSISNGIDVEAVRPVHHIDSSNINLLCVSTCEKWHGYDRLLNGLVDYYNNSTLKNKKKVIVHVVGDGSELEWYKKIVTDGKIQDYVIFYGKKYGKELDDIYDNIDICVGCLGLHRKGLTISSELKSRESMAKGIPYVASCEIDVFNKYPTKYFLKLKNGEDNINICEIVDFYNKIYFSEINRQDVINEIRGYALENIDLNKTMEAVIKYIKEGRM